MELTCSLTVWHALDGFFVAQVLTLIVIFYSIKKSGVPIFRSFKDPIMGRERVMTGAAIAAEPATARVTEEERERERQVRVAFARALEVRANLKIPLKKISATLAGEEQGVPIFHCKAGTNGTSAMGEAYLRPGDSVSVEVREIKADGRTRVPVEPWLRVSLCPNK